MNEVVVVAVLEVRPEAIEHADDLLKDIMAATHGERGCLRYALHRDMTKPGRVVMIEKWASQHAFDAHLVSPQVERMRALAAELGEGEVQSFVCTPIPLGDPAKGLL